ncbi:protein ADP-ribosyltransferase PARP3 isoform X2 [Andrographis paniculata]|uniref:protein ADP-ribosyltransferase PARP3 isoform X2 n=1 Tax=Andrographis paniculata TaxID=175694 RepID=UPI0021E94A23|nr:protein ADP-ribosyltransferase PARP3 isoform X2 [Andrographis paniculata]
MQVQETRSGEGDRMVTRKQKAEAKTGEAEAEAEHAPKKARADEEDEEREKQTKKEETESRENNWKSTEDVKAEFERLCKVTREHLSIQQMRDILEANGQNAAGSDDAVVPRCQDILYYGPLDDCPICGGFLEVSDSTYTCTGTFSEWSACIYNTHDPPRTDKPLVLPDSIKNSGVVDLLKKHQDPKDRPRPLLRNADKPFKGMLISLSGRLSRTHQYWKSKIERHGGKVVNSVNEATCLVVSPAERERGGSSKLSDALEKGIPVVREAWLSDSIERKQSQPLDSYDVATDLAVAGRGIPLYRQDAGEEALATIAAELKMYGKRSVHKDTKLQDHGGRILEKDGILYNCAFAACDCWHWHGLNEYGHESHEQTTSFCIMQLIMVPDDRLYLYYKKGKIGDEAGIHESLDEYKIVDEAIRKFVELFEAETGNEFEPWEREKKIHKKKHKLFPIDMDDGVDVRHGGLGLRQLGVAAAHCKLEPRVANFMKVLCGQEIYRYALMEMGLDFPELPLAMLTENHLKTCEKFVLELVDKLRMSKETGIRRDSMWSDFSQRIFTLLPSVRPDIFRDFEDVANHAAAVVEAVRDINVASRLIGDMSGATLDDPLFERYKKLGCSISAVEKDTDDYRMVSNYLEKTYEPVKVGEISYGVSIDNVFSVELSSCPSYDEIKKLPNKVLLWCGTRSSNLLRHLHKGFLPAICFLPAAGYMFGKAIVCSDAAAEAARYGFTAVDRPEGFLVLAVASLGDHVTQLTSPPKDTKTMEEKKIGAMGLGRKKTDESEHFMWKDDIKIPSGKLIPSEHKDSFLDYNEFAVYDPNQVSIRFLVAVKFEEKGVEYDTAE